MLRFLDISGKRFIFWLIVFTAIASLQIVRASRTEIVLHSFAGGVDGAYPQADLLIDSAGNLYGTTPNGGDASCNLNGQPGCGTVFKVTPDGTETVLYTFHGGADGGVPMAGLAADRSGSLYGTTYGGGDLQCTAVGCGTVFKLASSNAESVLHAFSLLSDGGFPWASLTKKGALYGTTYNGGDYNCNEFVGCGTAFKVMADGSETVLHAFGGNADGSYPQAGLVADHSGNFYGTTENGGGANCTINGQHGCGTVFRLTAQGSENVLYAFKGGKDGSFPLAGLLSDSAGTLYGTTSEGGAANAGVVFRVSSMGEESLLLAFDGAEGGSNPHATLIADRRGNLYGTTAEGGAANAGTVFKVSPAGKETVLYSFRGNGDGASPFAGVVTDRKGNLYGTTKNGGAYGYGTVYKINRQPLPQHRDR